MSIRLPNIKTQQLVDKENIGIDILKGVLVEC